MSDIVTAVLHELAWPFVAAWVAWYITRTVRSFRRDASLLRSQSTAEKALHEASLVRAEHRKLEEEISGLKSALLR